MLSETRRDEGDYQNHIDYLQFNPVKHGLAIEAGDWPYSSFHHWAKQGGLSPALGLSMLRSHLSR